MKILWLASWYPNRLAPYTGDFIQRHARAVSLYHDVQVIYITRDPRGQITKDRLSEKFRSKNLRERVIYYYSRKLFLGPLERFISQLKYERLFRKQVRAYLKKYGRPDLVHVHVGMKAGRIARWLHRSKGIPYVLTEHWTGFLPEAKDGFSSLPAVVQNEWKRVASHAAGISTVSDYLAGHVKNVLHPSVPVRVIPNVVDTALFHPVAVTNKNTVRFIHISGLDHQKDFESILQAFLLLKEKGYDFRLDVFGPLLKAHHVWVYSNGLEKQIFFNQEIPQVSLAKEVQQADALVSYSRYETFGCVIIEANAAGIPVIVSDIPVMHELVEQGKNGMLVQKENPVALADALGNFIDDSAAFNKTVIAEETAKKYNYETVGKMFSDWYKQLLNKASS